MNYNYPQYNNSPAYPYMQPNMQSTAIPQQPIRNELMLVMIKDDASVQNYPVANGNTVVLMNYDSGKFWIKSMTNGVTPTITEHQFEIVKSDNNSNTDSLISREEFNKLCKDVEKLQKIIDDLNS